MDGATLAAGAAVSYQVQGRRFAPIILFVEPENNLDVALAAYGGAGGAETAYVLPLGTVAYSLKIREVNNGPAAFQILVIAME